MLNVAGFAACLVLVLGFALSRQVRPERPVQLEADLAARVDPERLVIGPAVRAASGDPAGRVGGPDHKPFRIYARGEGRPFDLGGDGPVVFGALRWSPIDAAGNVTLTAEGLRDLCNYVYRDGWRFGSMAHRAEAPAAQVPIDEPDGSR